MLEGPFEKKEKNWAKKKGQQNLKIHKAWSLQQLLPNKQRFVS